MQQFSGRKQRYNREELRAQSSSRSSHFSGFSLCLLLLVCSDGGALFHHTQGHNIPVGHTGPVFRCTCKPGAVWTVKDTYRKHLSGCAHAKAKQAKQAANIKQASDDVSEDEYGDDGEDGAYDARRSFQQQMRAEERARSGQSHTISCNRAQRARMSPAHELSPDMFFFALLRVPSSRCATFRSSARCSRRQPEPAAAAAEEKDQHCSVGFVAHCDTATLSLQRVKRDNTCDTAPLLTLSSTCRSCAV